MIKETLLTLKLFPIGPVDGNNPGIPETPGVYIAVTANTYATFYRIIKFLYIGKTEDTNPGRGLKGRIADHVDQDHPKWIQICNLHGNNQIVYFYIPITGKSARLIPNLEAALINFFKPEANIEYKDAIPSNLRLWQTIIIKWPPFLGFTIINPWNLKYKP